MSKQKQYFSITKQEILPQVFIRSNQGQLDILYNNSESFSAAASINNNPEEISNGHFNFSIETKERDSEDEGTEKVIDIGSEIPKSNKDIKLSICNNVKDNKLGSDSDDVGSESDTSSNSSETNESSSNQNDSGYNKNHEVVTKNNKDSNETSELEAKEEESREKKESLENKDYNLHKIHQKSIHYSGDMKKKRRAIMSRKNMRFFKLRRDGTLTWSKNKKCNEKPKKTLNLSLCERIIKCTKEECFILETKKNINKKMAERKFTCTTGNERDEWVRKIIEVCDHIQCVEESLRKNSSYWNNYMKYRKFVSNKISSKIDKSKLKANEMNTAKNSCYLSDWIYNPTDKLLDEYKEIYAEKQNKTTADSKRYRIVIDKKHRPGQKNDATVYIVFKGTSIEEPMDCITDLGIEPTPFEFFDEINMESMTSEEIEDQTIRVHGGMYCAMRQVYCQIIKKLQKMRQNKINFKKVVVTGHSLGGGIGILFCLNLLKRKYFFKQNTFLNDIDFSLITFGAPSVIIPNKNLNKSKIGLKILKKLSEISIHFVNNLDIVPRILVNDMWRSKMLIHWIDLKVNSFVKTVCDYDSRVEKLDYFLSKIKDEYKPLGTFCFLQKRKNLLLIKNLDTIEEILNYHPPVMSKNEKLIHKDDDKKTCCLDLAGYGQILEDHKISSYMGALQLKNYKNNTLINKM